MSRTPLIDHPAPLGRPADRIAAGAAGLGLLGSIAMTIWFFAGFAETDPEFRAVSSAFLLALGLGAFAIVPAAVIMKLAHGAWRRGFQVADGLWTLALAGPWIILSSLLLIHAPIPNLAPVIALSLSVLLCFWALISLVLEARRAR